MPVRPTWASRAPPACRRCFAAVTPKTRCRSRLPSRSIAAFSRAVRPSPRQAALQGVVGPAVEIKRPEPVIVSDPSPLRPDVLAAVTKTVHSLYPGVPIAPKLEPYATDGALFRSVGIPTYGVSEIFMKDSDDFRHGLNERLPVKSFYDGLEFWYLLLKEVAAPKPLAG